MSVCRMINNFETPGTRIGNFKRLDYYSSRVRMGSGACVCVYVYMHTHTEDKGRLIP